MADMQCALDEFAEQQSAPDVSDGLSERPASNVQICQLRLFCRGSAELDGPTEHIHSICQRA